MHLQTEERARLRKKSLTYDKDDTTLYAAPVIKNTDDDLDERGSLLRGLVSDTDSDGVEDRDLLLPAEFHTSCSGLFVLKKLSSLSLSLSLSHTHISISHSLSLSHLYLSIYLSSIYLSAYLSVCLDLSLFPSFPDMFSSCSLFLTYALFYSCGTNGWRVLNSTVGSGFHSISEVDSSLRLRTTFVDDVRLDMKGDYRKKLKEIDGLSFFFLMTITISSTSTLYSHCYSIILVFLFLE